MDQVVRDRWESHLKRRFPDILRDARKEAIASAAQANITVGDDFSVLKPFPPRWIDEENWADMIDRVWNTPKWKGKADKARQNRNTLVDGEIARHTGGSISVSHHHHRMVRHLSICMFLSFQFHTANFFYFFN